MRCDDVESERAAGVSVQIGQITAPLARFLGRTVVDQTGLTGKHDVTLDFALDDMQLGQFLPPGAPKPPSDGDRPSIFAAVEEQLGLKLESQKGPVETIVVDRVERPSEN